MQLELLKFLVTFAMGLGFQNKLEKMRLETNAGSFVCTCIIVGTPFNVILHVYSAIHFSVCIDRN